jgi:hypothetical protein
MSTAAAASYTATAGDIGVNLNSNGFGLTGYYYSGSGIGTTTFGNGATTVAPDTLTAATANANKRDSDGGYVQLTYVTPVKTKVGIAYGVSNLDMASGETAAANTNVKSNERWTIGAYHPLTKHLNLVAEFNQISSENHRGQTNESNTYSAGGILFF